MLSLVSGMAGAPARALDVPMPVPVEKPQLDENGNIVVEKTLQNGLSALDDGEIEQARDILGALTTGSLDEKILSWTMAMSRGAGLSVSELAAARDRFADWPGDETIATNFEVALYRENRTPAQLLAAFKNEAPVTVMGKIALANALRKLGRDDEAKKTVKELWNDVDLDSRTASLLAREFRSYLTKEDQLARMKRLLYRDRIKAALAPSRAAGAESLY